MIGIKRSKTWGVSNDVRERIIIETLCRGLKKEKKTLLCSFFQIVLSIYYLLFAQSNFTISRMSLEKLAAAAVTVSDTS